MMDDAMDKAAQQKQVIAGIFDRSAPTYDQVGPRFFAHYGQGLVDFAEIGKGSHVLDIAAGRGAILFPAARAVGKSGKLVGIDLAETMVKETHLEIQQRHLENVTILLMDAENLQFPDESFDCVLCGFALFFFPRLDLALSEMHRVLRPQGCLAVSTWEKYEDERWKWFDKLVEEYLPPEPDVAQDAVTQPLPPQLDTAQSMAEVLNSAGFIDVHSRSEQLEVVYRNAEEWWKAQWSHGGRSTLEQIESTCGKSGLERFRVAAFEGLSRIKQADGIHTAWPALLTSARRPGK